MLSERNWQLDHLLQGAGWDFQRAVFVKDMAKLGKEPLSSMGHDRVLTIFSQYHPTLFKYLQQTFAEVTNPPIDPYREGGAMSLTTYLGRSPLKAGTTTTTGDELPIKQMELSSPVISDVASNRSRPPCKLSEAARKRRFTKGITFFASVISNRASVELIPSPRCWRWARFTLTFVVKGYEIAARWSSKPATSKKGMTLRSSWLSVRMPFTRT
jgi:hypothetical protein